MKPTDAEIIKAAEQFILSKYEGYFTEFSISDHFEEEELYGDTDRDEAYSYMHYSNVNIRNSGRLKSLEPNNSNVCICYVEIGFNISHQYYKDDENHECEEEALLIVLLDKRDLRAWTWKNCDDLENVLIEENEDSDELTEVNLNAILVTNAINQIAH